ncbi:MAG: sigma-70 family RNA polymerase sigma factor [Actinomycetota bacterium]
MPERTRAAFSAWVADAEPRLRHALTASFGPQVGEEAVADAVAFAWEHWADISGKSNPIGYVFGVARNKARRLSARRPPRFPDAPAHLLPRVEPGLPAALSGLPEQQRIVVTLVYGYEWTMSEVAELLGTKKTTVQNHAERGLKKLRGHLGVDR